jgi:hypothetical protein
MSYIANILNSFWYEIFSKYEILNIKLNNKFIFIIQLGHAQELELNSECIFHNLKNNNVIMLYK